MFTDSVYERWESTASQDAFIKDYFGKQTPLKKSIKTSKKTGNSAKNFDVTDLKNERVVQCRQNNTIGEVDISSNFSSRTSSKKKKKRKSCNKNSPNKHDSNPQKEAKLEKKCLKDSLVDYSNSLKYEKKKNKFKSKDKNLLMIQTKINYSDQSDCTEENERKEDCDNSATTKSMFSQSKAYQKLQAAKFRYLNELLYTNTGKDALSYFKQNTDEFEDYHLGYQSQVAKWPINPVDIIIKELRKMNKQSVVADLGCGEAKIAATLPDRTVHSFDLIALKDCVTACDMANVPLPDESVDITVFCLSLMGTNWKDYLLEGRRILKLGATLKIAEIESRIDDVNDFIKNIEYYGFSLTNKNLSHKMFVFLNFKKVKKNVKASKVKAAILKPCMYKKR